MLEENCYTRDYFLKVLILLLVIVTNNKQSVNEQQETNVEIFVSSMLDV